MIIFYLAIGFTLLAISIHDIKRKEVPDSYLVLLFFFVIQYVYLFKNGLFTRHFIEGIFTYFILFILTLLGKLTFRKPILGGADIKLMTCLCLLLGLGQIVYILLISCILALLFFLFFYLKQHLFPIIPFTPFIIVSTLLVFLLKT